MIFHLLTIAAILAAATAACSLGYYVLCLYSAGAFHRKLLAGGRARATAPLPPASVLKPLKGNDPAMYESLRSHCLQDHPEYEIIFGVSDSGDAAVPVVQRLQTEFPQRGIRLLVCDKNLGANKKVSTLAQMLPAARHEIIVVSDSDIRVPPGYLQRVAGQLGDPGVGLVTCLYRGVPAPTFGSRLEALGISTDFAAGVLAARQLEGGIRFGLGSTLAFRRSDFEATGGFEAVADYLADDYQVGKRIAARGHKIALSEIVVETFLPPYSWPEFWQHQVRWGRAVRDSRRGGHFGLILTFGIPWSVLALLASGGAVWAWILLAAVLGLRVAVAFVVGWFLLRDRQAIALLPLLLLRDFTALLIWMASLTGHTVVWRGQPFRLKEGKLIPIASE